MVLRIAQNGERWRLLPFGQGPIDEELAAADGMLAGLEAGGPPAVRWYTARALGVVVGAGQRPAEVDGAALAAHGATLHRRASGGTAVLFAPGFLMQDVALPVGHPLWQPDVTESYRWLGELWLAALARLGVADARLVGVAEAREDTRALGPLERRACFGGRSPYEVLAGGRKLVGFSQLRRRAGAVLQVGLYRRWEPGRLAALLAVAPEERAALAGGLAARVAGLAEVAPADPGPDAVMAAFGAALAAAGVGLAAADWSPAEAAARAAARQRYGALELEGGAGS